MQKEGEPRKEQVGSRKVWERLWKRVFRPDREEGVDNHESLPKKKKYRNISPEKANQVLQDIGEVNFTREKGGYHKTDVPMSYLFSGVEEVKKGLVRIDIKIKILKKDLPDGHMMKIDQMGDEIETTRNLFINTFHPKGHITIDLDNLHREAVTLARQFTLREYDAYR